MTAKPHSLQETSEFFAVKTLLGRTILGKEKEFEQEVRMLKRLCHSHPHLISLLATYKHCEHYHLIFPWAECNLQTYWKTKNPDPPHNLDTILWMARQCEGIAEGLDRVHHHETTSVSSLFAIDSIAMRTPRTPISPGFTSQAPGSRLVFGRHGDIKPTNLLWFPNLRDSSDKGTIKISDFGTGVFSTTDFAPHTSTSVSHSPPYRPPECDLSDSIIDNSYDIWTLGCLYLEFITWFIGGWKLLEELEELRKWNSKGPCRTNAYFEINDDQSQGKGAQPWDARVKPAVLEVRRPSSR
jgi:serine/threonine protein kinase